MKAIIISAILLGFVLAVIFITKLVSYRILMRKDKKVTIVTTIPIKRNADTIEYLVRSILWKKDWSSIYEQQILLVIFEEDDESLEICCRLCEQYESLAMCKPEELQHYISEITQS